MRNYNSPPPIKNSRRRLLLVDREVLPEGYTRLEYLESNGSQYVDTGYYGTNNTRIVIDAIVVSYTNSYSLICGDITDKTKAISINTNATSNVVSRFGSSSVYNGYVISLGSRNVFEISNEGTKLNGELTSTWDSVSDFTTSGTLHVFQGNGSTNNAVYKLYSLDIFENNVVVKRFIPCTNASGYKGMYDLVTQVFYPLQGTIMV